MNAHRITYLAAVALAAVVAAAGVVHASDAVQEKTGSVGLVGTAPNIRVSFIDDADNKTYLLTGVWTDELKTLGGVKLALRVMPVGGVNQTDPMQLPELQVLEYEIVDVGGGVKPYVGFLHTDNGKLVLHVAGFGVPIVIRAPAKVTATLKNLVGSKLWMTGKLGAGPVLRLTRMNVIKKAEPKPEN